MEIGWIKTYNKLDGGDVYTGMVMDALSKKHEQEEIYVTNELRPKLWNRGKQYFDLLKLRGSKDIWFRDIQSTITMPYDRTSGKNLLIFHHFDSSVRGYVTINKVLSKLFYRNIKKIGLIVVVSKYWRDHFTSKGHENVELIYNGFELNHFKFNNKDVANFKERYGLTEKPIVYIGMCQKSKGVIESYAQLKDLDVYLVTSGERRANIPSINLDLDYREYLLLLKASSVVVTMSKFKEGWCRTAHEAVLCKTPVIGSGLGGMGELLINTNQIICRDFRDLKKHVLEVLENPEIDKKGYNYARKFTRDRFEKEWVALIDSMEVEN